MTHIQALVVFQGKKRYKEYVEFLKNHTNAVDVTFNDAIKVAYPYI